MADFTLAQGFSMIALNAQRSSHKSVVKQVALRMLAAAVVLECYLEGKLRATGDEGQGGAGVGFASDGFRTQRAWLG